MSETFIRIVGEDGQPMHMPWDFEQQGPLPDFAEEIPRLPKPFEEWTGKAFVEREGSQKAKADAAAGVEHIAEARLQKRIEAVLIASGVVLTSGLIAEEARLRGVEPAALATMVLEKAADFAAIEMTRQESDLFGDEKAVEVPATEGGKP